MNAADREPLESGLGLASRLARQWWPQLVPLAAACGVVATTIAGALGVGEALRGGLRALAVERLGRIDAAVLGEELFTGRLAAGLGPGAGGPRQVVPAIVLPAIAARGDGAATRITLLACDDPVALGFEPAPPPLEAGGVLVNEPLATAIGLASGDAVVIRLPRPSSVPADSPLGRRSGDSTGRRLEVTAVLPPQGIGQFALRPTQTTLPLAITSLAEARRLLGRDDAANALLAVGMPAGSDPASWLQARLEPTLADYGLALEQASTDPPSLRLVSRRLILPAAVDVAASEILAPLDGQPTLTFLANAIAPVGADADPSARVPYSTVLGIDSTSLPVGDLVDERGDRLPLPGDDGIIIDRWLADDLAAQGRPVAIGDRLRLEFFEPETVHGRVTEAAAELRITGIAEMRGAATARGVVPEVEGITDEESIADWDPPFPFEPARVRTTPPHDEDDRYWKEHGPTPKAFVSLATARRLAAGRFGGTTAWLLPQATVGDIGAVAARLAAALEPAALGLRVVPLRSDALAAARGSTPFGGLFLSLSSFVIIAGLLLIGLLLALLAAARSQELGILAAVGFAPRRLATLLVAVGGAAAAAGVLAGTLAGPAWAAALLGLLRRAWTAEVEAGSGRAFEAAAPAATSLAAAAGAALVISLVALVWAARRVGRLPPLGLLKRGLSEAGRQGRARVATGVALGGLAVALLVSFWGRGESAQAAAGIFFAAGFSALAGLLAAVRVWLVGRPAAAPARTLAGLALRNLGFAPGRAFSVAAIVATAAFLIVAVSSFAQRPPPNAADRRSPTGGWTELVSFGSPTGVDPADTDVRSGLGLSTAQQELIAACEIARLRTSGGDDAACTNLYATLRPTVIGVGPGFVRRGGFTFVAHAPLPQGDDASPWTLLDRSADAARSATAAEPVPAILDQATAQWGLKLGGVGAEFTLPDDAGRPVRFRIVGLLEPGILQGAVIVTERDFERVFPDRSGYGMALVDASAVTAAQRPDVAAALTAAWADAGTTITPTARRLASLQAVQNTFLAGFQALGTLGLLLGTAGVAAVQLQGALERIGPLSVMRAVGFTVGRVRGMLVLETLLMVGLGLVAGIAAALLAVAPALASGQARLPVAWIAATCAASLLAALVAAAVAATKGVIPVRPQAE
ncbi:MAG: FtsX-like permease family protein [Planctomycetota bacterium]